MSPLLSVYCILSNLPGPPSITFQNMTFQLWPVDRRLCPPVDPDRDVIFYLHTDLNPEQPQVLKRYDDRSLSASYMDFSKPTVIFFHGFLESYRSANAQVIKNAYIQKGGYNVILVQTERLLAGPDYIHAAGNCKPIGEFAGSFIDYLVTMGLSLKRLHVIGFSLGAQSAGFAGKSVKSGRLTRITGLEPAGPLFNGVGASERITPEDAEFVDVIHTNAGIFGIKYNVGDSDFWPNGGGMKQPGCSILEIIKSRGVLLNWFIFCNHYRAYQLYSQSINDRGAFPAKNCKNYKYYKKGVCSTEINYMGIAANPRLTGDFFLDTGLEAANI